MSNNNPHGHITQPTQNPSWNHLQIPSYIPRQPQLAHMSNERPMVRSPSAWHAPAPPPDSLYNFMSANHKNLEHQMNTLLPRSLLPPFDSMDLSLQSSRSSSSPLNKAVGGHAPVMLPHEYGGHKHGATPQPPGSLPPHQHQQHSHQQQAHQHQQQQQQQQQQSQLHGPNSYPIPNLSSNSPSSLAQQQQQQHQQQSQHAHHSQLSALQTSPATHGMQSSTSQSPASPAASQGSGKYMNTNGNDCEGMLPPSGTNSGGPTTGGGNNNGAGGSNGGGGGGGGPSPVHSYMREQNDAPTHMGDGYGKMSHLAHSYETEMQPKGAGSKPVELVSKDCNYPSLISNKMTPHASQQSQQQHPQQAQVSPKKHSPMRNYHAQQQHQHHHQQQQQQQQQQQHSPFNNPSQSTMKHNGPHTPPTPQSPVIHQQSGGPLHGMDYNQMHLQQQPPQQGAYPHQQHSQQQQQHMSQHLPPPPPQHAILYPPHPHTHSHSHSLLPPQSAQQQQQLPQQNQQHHVSSQQQHIHPPMHQTQQQHQHQVSPRLQQHQQHQQQQQPLQSHQQNSSPPMPHSMSTQSLHSNPSNLTRPEDTSTVASNASKSSTYNIHVTEMKKSSPHGSNTITADLSPAGTGSAANIPYSTSGSSVPKTNCIPDSAESPSPEAVSSHCESLDSNSNSSGGGGGGGGAGFRHRLQKRGSGEGQSAINEHDAVDFDNVLLSQSRADVQQQRQQLAGNNIPRSPKYSPPEQMRRSPRKCDIKSPVRNLNKSPPTATTSLDTLHIQHEKMSIASTPSSPTNQAVENGRIPTAATNTPTLRTMSETFVDSEVETIDKISAMIASTTNESTAIADANSNSSIKSVGERESSIISSGSPKTKKQRQALKLRNAAEYNSNSNGSSNSYGAIANAQNRCMAMSDNAMAADELRKELMQSELQHADGSNGDKPVAPTKKTNRDSAAGINIETEADTRVRHPPPLSPQSNSHSSSSSSSSSSCSNSSHSSIGSKTATRDMTGTTQREKCAAIASTETIVDDEKKANQPADSDKKITTQLGDNEPLDLNVHKTDTVTASFEEVENKLEEMFAGIEDEPILQEPEDIASQPPANTTEVVRDLSLALELSTNISTQQSALPNEESRELDQSANACAKDVSAPLHVRTDGPPPTKAAKKSTLPSPVRKPISETPPTASPVLDGAAQNVDINESTKTSDALIGPSAAAGRRSGPPRRRLSVAMDPTNLRILLDDDPDYTDTRPQRAKRLTAAKKNNNYSNNNSANSKDVIICLDDDDDQPSTSAAAAAALAAKIAAASTAKEAASRSVGGSGSNAKAAPKNAKGRKTQDTRKRPSRAADAGKGGGKKKLTGKQQQGRKQQRNSLENEAPAAQSSTAEQIKSKSPFILVKQDGSISVVNAPLNAEDINEKHAGARQLKKPAGAAGYAHDRKNLRGLHSSTLSTKYDADTTDSTWICVFCKRGPHRMGLGDLFGPYLVTVDCEEYKAAIKAPDALDLDAIFLNKRRRIDMVQTNPRNLPVVPAKNSALGIGATPGVMRTPGGGKKKKKSIDTSTPIALPVVDPLDCTADEALQQNFLGMTKVSESSYEVWLHEDCIVWAPDVFLVGVRVMGLDAAVWNSTNYECTLCGKPGAIVCCLQRDCKAAAHVPCAREDGWDLIEDRMNVYCQLHAVQAAVTTTTTTTAVTTTPAANEPHTASSGRQSGLKKS